MPVGPPWITHSSGYFFDGSRFAGLISTPSIVAPSLDFQLMTSRLPSCQLRIGSLMAVTTRGTHGVVLLTAISGSAPGEATVKPTFDPPDVRENPLNIPLSGPDTRVTRPLAGSSRKRCAAVLWDPANQMAPARHWRSPGFSSKLSVSDRGVPPLAATTAIRVFDAK